MPQPYLFISFTALLLTPGTRKRPPQSGSVQTGFWEVSVRCGRLWLMLRQGSPTTSLLMRSVY
jgi:hypothetical protein